MSVGAHELVSDGCIGIDAVEFSARRTIISTAAFSFKCPACCSSSQRANKSDGVSCCLVGLPSGAVLFKFSSVATPAAAVAFGRGMSVAGAAEAIAAASYKHSIINFNQ